MQQVDQQSGRKTNGLISHQWGGGDFYQK
ncbi:hypothetical protein FQN60_003672 [Etheostoma spectabile]|uniref:Uncharacterized protein n=1 Tax=Etheostoma spectabile TaxID=54343 RepID=A0A5J5CRT9_9PERO|nr:hypothetical protein FQN60_003672 [Etheostoma spectabile]